MSRMRGIRSLRVRLLLWFFGAIILAFTSSALVVGFSRPEAFTSGTEVMARTMGTRLDAVWDDPVATNAYVSQVEQVTGFDVRLIRDPAQLPRGLKRAGQRGRAFVP